MSNLFFLKKTIKKVIDITQKGFNSYISLTKRYKMMMYIHYILLILLKPFFVLYEIIQRIINFVQQQKKRLKNIYMDFYKKFIQIYFEKIKNNYILNLLKNFFTKYILKPLKNFFIKYILKPLKNFFIKYILKPLKNFFIKYILKPLQNFFTKYILKPLQNFFTKYIIKPLDNSQIYNNIREIHANVKWLKEINSESYNFYKKLYEKKFEGSWKNFLKNRKTTPKDFNLLNFLKSIKWSNFYKPVNWVKLIRSSYNRTYERLNKINLGFYDENKKLQYNYLYVTTITYGKYTFVLTNYIKNNISIKIAIIMLFVFIIIFLLCLRIYIIYNYNLNRVYNFDINEPDFIFLITLANILLNILFIYAFFLLLYSGFFYEICMIMWYTAILLYKIFIIMWYIITL